MTVWEDKRDLLQGNSMHMSGGIKKKKKDQTSANPEDWKLKSEWGVAIAFLPQTFLGCSQINTKVCKET